MKRIILVSIISGVLFGQQSKPKHYRSAGFLDHKTGMSLVSYARTLKYNNKSEYFVGIGTLIAANTFALGWKYSFLQPETEYDPNTGEPIIGLSTGFIDDYYVVASAHSVMGMGGGFVSPFFAFGFEKRLTKKLYINVGINSLLRIYSGESIDSETGEVRPAQEFITFPTINLNYRY